MLELGAGVGPLVRHAAVYPGLPAGRYTVWQAHTPVAAVTVTSGQVSSCHWPG